MQEERLKEENFSSDSAVEVKKRRGFPAKVLAYTAVLTALSALCNIFTVNFGIGNSMAISLTYLPNFLAGAFLGPLPGFVCGLLGDLIGCWIAPKGDINPIILLSSGLLGLIPGVVFMLFRGKNKEIKYPIVAAIVSMIAVYAVCTTLNTIGLYVFYFKAKGRTLAAVFALRTPPQTIVWVVNAFLCVILYLPIRKLLRADKI